MNDLRRLSVTGLFFVVLLLSSGAFAPLWTDTATFSHASEGSPALQLVWTILYLTVAALILPYLHEILELLNSNRTLLLILALCFVSAIWSADPALTLRKSLALTGTSLAGLLLAWRFELRDQVRVIAVVLGVSALASLIFALAFPSLFPATEFSTGWNGVFSHKNLLGRSMCLGTIAFLSLERRTLSQTFFSFGGAVLCFALLLRSHSQTALLVLIAMLLLMALSSLLRSDWRPALGAMLLLLVACVPLTFLASNHSGEWLSHLGRDATLTGRTKIWQVALLSLEHRPWFGYGYGAFWWVSRESRQALALLHYQTPHAHNALLDLGLQIGVVGAMAFLVLWLGATVAGVRHLCHAPEPGAHWPLLCLAFCALYSVSESSVPAANSLLWILFASACASTARAQNIRERIALRLQTLTASPVTLP